MTDWGRLKAEYIAGGTSYRKLAKENGLTLAEVRSVAKREEWVKLRERAQHRANTKIADAIGNQTAKQATDIINVADKLLDKIIELIETAPLESQAIRQLTSALKDLREIKGIKTEADIREQNARIKNLERQIAADGAESKPITIVLAGDTDKYSK